MGEVGCPCDAQVLAFGDFHRQPSSFYVVAYVMRCLKLHSVSPVHTARSLLRSCIAPGLSWDSLPSGFWWERCTFRTSSSFKLTSTSSLLLDVASMARGDLTTIFAAKREIDPTWLADWRPLWCRWPT